MCFFPHVSVFVRKAVFVFICLYLLERGQYACICLYLSQRGQDVCICLYLSIFVREGARSMLIKHWPALGAPRPHFLSQTLSPLFPRPSRRIQQSARSPRWPWWWWWWWPWWWGWQWWFFHQGECIKVAPPWGMRTMTIIIGHEDGEDDGCEKSKDDYYYGLLLTITGCPRRSTFLKFQVYKSIWSFWTTLYPSKGM